MNSYSMCSDLYRSLHNMFWEGNYYSIEELTSGEYEITDEQLVKLIKENLYG